MTGFESQAVISKPCLDVVLIVMAGFDNQVRFYVRLVLMSGRPSVIDLKQGKVNPMATISVREIYYNMNILETGNVKDHTKLELVIPKSGDLNIPPEGKCNPTSRQSK